MKTLQNAVTKTAVAVLVCGFEHAPLADPRAHMLQDELVDLGGDPARRPAVPLGEEEPGLGMFEPGVGARIYEPVHLGLERWHPIGVVPVDLVGDVDERLAVGGILDGADGHGHDGSVAEGGSGRKCRGVVRPPASRAQKRRERAGKRFPFAA